MAEELSETPDRIYVTLVMGEQGEHSSYHTWIVGACDGVLAGKAYVEALEAAFKAFRARYPPGGNWYDNKEGVNSAEWQAVAALDASVDIFDMLFENSLPSWGIYKAPQLPAGEHGVPEHRGAS